MPCWSNRLFILVVVVLGLLAMLGACGQKGDLYLPEPNTESTTPPGADVPDLPGSTRPPKTDANQP
jgi:predicted small lipoprotein YifL